ncbi:putative non-specific serine/threonine protein kinase [Arabidopsis thaliana]
MKAKISDFGCIKLVPKGVDSVETLTVVGTFNYILIHIMLVSFKRVKKGRCICFRGDSNGVDHMKKVNDETLSVEEQNLVMWLCPKIKDSTFLNLVDGTIATDEETIKSIKKIAKLAEYYTSQEVESRPLRASRT